MPKVPLQLADRVYADKDIGTVLPRNIIERILRTTDQKALVTCARVSSAWSEVALDSIWKELTDVVPILELFGPLDRSNPNKLVR